MSPEPPQMNPDIKSIKEILIYYVCFMGVNSKYGSKIYQSVRFGQLDVLTVKKRTIIDEINRLPEITDLEIFNTIKIKGIGEGGMDFVREYYFKVGGITYPTDRVFRKRSL